MQRASDAEALRSGALGPAKRVYADVRSRGGEIIAEQRATEAEEQYTAMRASQTKEETKAELDELLAEAAARRERGRQQKQQEATASSSSAGRPRFTPWGRTNSSKYEESVWFRERRDPRHQLAATLHEAADQGIQPLAREIQQRDREPRAGGKCTRGNCGLELLVPVRRPLLREAVLELLRGALGPA